MIKIAQQLYVVHAAAAVRATPIIFPSKVPQPCHARTSDYSSFINVYVYLSGSISSGKISSSLYKKRLLSVMNAEEAASNGKAWLLI
jgi:hypothetical protein